MPIGNNLDIEVLQNEKIRTQFTFLVKAVQDLFDCIKENKDELFVQSLFVPLYQDQFAIDNANSMLKRTEGILNNISGQVSGYHKEIQLSFKQIRKKTLDNSTLRTVNFGTRGDVAIDYGGGFGKAIQSKSSFADNSTDIDMMIKVAANQLTGERVAKETPLISDRRIIDVSIKNPANPWPRDVLGHTPFTLTEVESKINALVAKYVQHNSKTPMVGNANKLKNHKGKGYNKWNELTPNMGTLSSQGSAQQPISRVMGINQSGNTVVGVDFVTKIRYDHARPFAVSGKLVHIRQITARTEFNSMANTTTTTWVIYK